MAPLSFSSDVVPAEHSHFRGQIVLVEQPDPEDHLSIKRKR